MGHINFMYFLLYPIKNVSLQENNLQIKYKFLYQNDELYNRQFFDWAAVKKMIHSCRNGRQFMKLG
jgi:hypothetical protein